MPPTPAMPQNALYNLKVDHCVPLSQMGELLVELVSMKPSKTIPVPKGIQLEADIAKRVQSDFAATEALGKSAQTAKIEETLWVALRMFEERKNMLQTMIHSGKGAPSRAAAERANESEVHIERIRAMLLSSDKASNDGAPKKREKIAK